MKLLKIDHLHFFAPNLDKAIEFYQDIGFEFIQKMKHGGRESAQLKTDFGLTIDINKTNVSDSPGYSHFAIMVDDVNEWHMRLTEKGYEVDGPTINKDTKRKIITFRDQNGDLVQMVQK